MDVLWVGLAGCGMFLLVRTITRSRAPAVVAAALYMLLLTGLVYSAGYSGLPGLALLPFVAHAAFARMPLIAGAGVALVGLTKANLAIVAAAVVLAALIESAADARRYATRAVLGFGAAAGAFALIFAVTGQLGPYVDQLRSSAAYSSDGLQLVHGRERPFGHLAVAWEQAAGALRWGVIASIVIALACASLARWPARVRRAGVLTAAAATGTVVTVGLTHIWPHHLQLLAFALACLGAFLWVAVIDAAPRFGRGERAVLAAGVALAVVVAWGAVDLQRPSVGTAERWGPRPTRRCPMRWPRRRRPTAPGLRSPGSTSAATTSAPPPRSCPRAGRCRALSSTSTRGCRRAP
jgi:hypothetical protein